jgi:hypothetical protein
MSHRSRIKDAKAREKKAPAGAARTKEPRLPRQIPKNAMGLQIMSGTFDAQAAVQIIGEIDHTARALASGDEPDLWSCLQKLDTDSEILGTLDKGRIDSIPQKRRGHALRAFHSALWTWLARHKGILGELTDRGIIAFTNKETYARTIPQVLPIAGDVPSFAEPVIGCLQDIIKGNLTAVDFIPGPYINADLLPPGTRAQPRGLEPKEGEKEPLPLEDYYACTVQTLEEVFEMIYEDMAKAKALAKGCAPFFFIWMGTQRILQHIVTGLVEGDPFVRKKPLPDGGFSYILRERGAGPGS